MMTGFEVRVRFVVDRRVFVFVRMPWREQRKRERNAESPAPGRGGRSNSSPRPGRTGSLARRAQRVAHDIVPQSCSRV